MHATSVLGSWKKKIVFGQAKLEGRICSLELLTPSIHIKQRPEGKSPLPACFTGADDKGLSWEFPLWRGTGKISVGQTRYLESDETPETGSR